MSWPPVKLGTLVTIKTGRLDANAADDEGIYPFFTCSRDPLRINTHAFDCDAILIAGNGDLNVKHYSGKFNAYQRTYVVTSLSEEILDTRYLFYFMDKYVERLRELSIGGVIKYIKLGMLTDAEIPLPPLPEQKRIAAILDKADAIRRKRQQAIQLADDFLCAMFLEMFGDPVTNPKGWETCKLGRLSRIRRGASPRPIADYLGGNIPWIKIGDGSKGDQIYLHDTKEHVTQAGADKSLYLEKGALVFANCGVSLGFARILSKAGCIHDGWLAIDELDARLNQVFLLKWINHLTLYFRSIAPDGTQPNLNTAIMKDQDVFLPPREMQDKYESLVRTHDVFLNKLRDSAALVESTFHAISQKAFSSQL